MTVPITSLVVLRGEAISLDTEIGRAFISDCARLPKVFSPRLTSKGSGA